MSRGPAEPEREFDLLMAACGVAIPPERKAGALAVYLDLRRKAERLRQTMSEEVEPSNVFLVVVVLRDPGAER